MNIYYKAILFLRFRWRKKIILKYKTHLA